MSSNSPQWQLQYIPEYGLRRDLVEAYVRWIYGDASIQVSSNTDYYSFSAPRLLNQEEKDYLKRYRRVQEIPAEWTI